MARLTAQRPDAFVAGPSETDSGGVLDAVRSHRAALRNPARPPEEYLAALERLGLTRTTALLRPHAKAI